MLASLIARPRGFHGLGGCVNRRRRGGNLMLAHEIETSCTRCSQCYIWRMKGMAA